MLWLAAGIAFFTLAQVASTEPPLSEADILAAIDRLGHPEFDQRESASNQLWRGASQANQP